jgi:hypothetical protein
MYFVRGVVNFKIYSVLEVRFIVGFSSPLISTDLYFSSISVAFKIMLLVSFLVILIVNGWFDRIDINGANKEYSVDDKCHGK